MRMRIAAIATSVAALAAPVAAQGSPTSVVPERQPAYEKHYRELRKQVVKHVGLNAAGRDIVSDGFREKNGDVHQATKAEVVASSDRMEASLNPPAPASTDTATSADDDHDHQLRRWRRGLVVHRQCESGGSYTAVNPGTGTTARTSSTSPPGTRMRPAATRARTRRPPRRPSRTRPRPACRMTPGPIVDQSSIWCGKSLGASAPGLFLLAYQDLHHVRAVEVRTSDQARSRTGGGEL